MSLETKVNPEPIEENQHGIVYSISHGSGGFKSSRETVRVVYTGDKFKVEFSEPRVVNTLKKFDDLGSAITAAQSEARKRLKRTVTRNHKRTEVYYDSYPDGVPEELSKLTETDE